MRDGDLRFLHNLGRYCFSAVRSNYGGDQAIAHGGGHLSVGRRILSIYNDPVRLAQKGQEFFAMSMESTPRRRWPRWSLKAIRTFLVRAAVFAIFLVGFGYLGYFAVGYFTEAEEPMAETQQLVPVIRDDLVVSVTTSGTVTFPERDTVSFSIPGTIGSVMVEEGQFVNAGDVIAAFDQSTVTGLTRAAVEAEVALADARDALKALTETADPFDIAKAESDLADAWDALEALEDAEALDESPDPFDIAKAESDLADAWDALEALEDAEPLDETPDPFDIAKAKNDLVDAEVQLEMAKDDLESLGNVEVTNDVAARVAIAEAAFAVWNAEEELARLRSLPDESVIDDSMEALAKARQQHDRALADLSLLDDDWGKNLNDSRSGIEDLEAEYMDSFEGWFGVSLAAAELSMPPSEVLASWNADLDAIFVRQTSATFDTTLPQEDPATPWSDRLVFVWNYMHPDPVVGTCDDDAPLVSTRCVEKELDENWDRLADARSAHATLKMQADNAITDSRIVVDDAQWTIDDSLEVVEDAQVPPEPEEIEHAVNLVTKARQAMADAREFAEELGFTDEIDVTLANAAVEFAEATVAHAKEVLDDLLAVEVDELSAGSRELAEKLGVADGIDVTLENAAVEFAEATVVHAKEVLDDLLTEDVDELSAGTSELAEKLGVADGIDITLENADMEFAVASVIHAKEALDELLTVEVDELAVELAVARIVEFEAALDAAESKLEQILIRAPFTGVVTAVNVSVGDSVTPDVVVAEFLDETVVNVAAVVDEIDVLKLTIGAEASIYLDALTGQTLTGIIEYIGDAESTQGVVIYPVDIRVDLTGDVMLREGLSATAEIVIRRIRNVLLIPSQAVGGTFTRPTVEVIEGGLSRIVPIDLGESDDYWVVVRSGLKEGDTIAMEVASGDEFGFPGFGGFGGGFGGGGLRR